MQGENFLKLAGDAWPFIVATVGVIVWLTRLESKVKTIERTQNTEGVRMVNAIDKLAATQERMSETINEMRTTLAGVVGYEKGASEARSKRTR